MMTEGTYEKRSPCASDDPVWSCESLRRQHALILMQVLYPEQVAQVAAEVRIPATDVPWHRTLLIGHALRGPELAIQHILADGRLEAHAASAQRLVHLVGEVTDAPQALEWAYEVQGHRIASTRYVISSWRAPS